MHLSHEVCISPGLHVESCITLKVDLGHNSLIRRRVIQRCQEDEQVLPLHAPKLHVHECGAIEETFERAPRRRRSSVVVSDIPGSTVLSSRADWAAFEKHDYRSHRTRLSTRVRYTGSCCLSITAEYESTLIMVFGGQLLSMIKKIPTRRP